MNTQVTQVRAGAWIGTVNNPTPEDRVALRTQQRWMRSCKGQDEVGENGTLHIQFLVCTDWIRMSSLKKWLPRAHFEPCRGAQHVLNACKYVHKAETAVEGTQFNFTYRGERDIISTNKVLVALYRIKMEFNPHEIKLILLGIPLDADIYSPEISARMAEGVVKQERLYYKLMTIYLTENPTHVNLFGNRVLKELWLNCQDAISAWYMQEEEERTAAADLAPDLV